MLEIKEEKLEKILPSDGPAIGEVKRYLNKYNNEYIVIKLLNTSLSIKTFPPYLITIKSFLYFSIYFLTSFKGGPSSGNIFLRSMSC